MVNLDDYSGGSFLKVADLGNKEHLVQIESIDEEEVGEERKLVCRFEGKAKGLVLNQAHITTLKSAFGKDTSEMIGATVILFIDPDVRYAGKRVGGVRLKLPSKPVTGRAAAKPTTAEYLGEDPDWDRKPN